MYLARRRHKLLIPGPILVGFSEFFDCSYGDPKSPRNRDGSYFKVTPAIIGGVLIPFSCPHCSAVKPEVIDPKTRVGYWDHQRKFSWCPSCRGRYVIDSNGTPLKKPIAIGATHAPALVERGGKTEILTLAENGLDLLGVE